MPRKNKSFRRRIFNVTQIDLAFTLRDTLLIQFSAIVFLLRIEIGGICLFPGIINVNQCMTKPELD